MNEISIPIHIKFTFDGEITIVNLSQIIRDLEIEKLILLQFIEKFNEMLTTELCGEKYQHGKKEKYERGGKSSRTITTMIGKITFIVDKIRDKLTRNITKPTLEKLDIKPYKNVQDDVSFTCADIATKSTYRDTNYIMKSFRNESISPSTINRELIENGKEIKEFMKKKNKDNEEEMYDYFYGDGTYSHSQEEGVYKNDVKVAISVNSQGEKVLLSCDVNKSWNDLSQEIEEVNVLSRDAVLVADAEPELKNALASSDSNYQLDYLHFIRDIGYKLWQDGGLDLDTRKDLKKQAEKIIYKLKNQVKKYKKDKESLKKKINEAVDKLKEFHEYLSELGCVKAAKFVKKYSNNVVTFAILATEGRSIPWNSNIIERLMGEIQKRCKHKWMRWTTQGQESILNLILTRYCNPENYIEFKNEKLKTKNIKNIEIKIKTK